MTQPGTTPPGATPREDPADERYERAGPIVDGRREFHPFVDILEVAPGERELRLRVSTRGGPVVHARLTFCDPAGLRVQWSATAPPAEHVTEMLVGPAPALPLTVEQLSDRIVVDAGGPPVVLRQHPWRLEFGDYRTEPDDTSLVTWVSPPSGVTSDGTSVGVVETFALRPGEQLWGTGERFVGPDVRGRRVAHWIDTALGTNSTDRVHKSIPLVLSSRGYGLFVHAPEEAVLDLGGTSTAAATVLVHAPEWDSFVFLGRPKEVLTRYTAVTGRAAEPPDWSYGVWLSRCMYADRAQVAHELDMAAQVGLPVGVVNLDPRWLAGRKDRTYDSCDFVADEEAFGPIGELAAWLHERDVRLCLWVNPYVHDTSPAYLPERLIDGGRCRDPWHPERAIVDFTGDGAAWWQAEMQRLLAFGVDCFKLDYGEMLPASAKAADGRTGRELHNLYPLLASQTAYGAGAPLCFTRGATAGSQRYPLHWPGDTPSTWAGLTGALRGGLAAAWSGIAHWTTDIPGFHRRDMWHATDPDYGFRTPDPELYVRWMQFGMLLSHTRFHNNRPAEPWYYGEAAVDATVRFARLRQRLRGYLRDCAREASATGWPVLRPLGLEFDDDIGSRHADTSYLLGPGLLVAPVLEPGGRAEFYLPPDGWTDVFTGARYEGPRWVRRDDVPLGEVPLLVREGHRPLEAE